MQVGAGREACAVVWAAVIFHRAGARAKRWAGRPEGVGRVGTEALGEAALSTHLAVKRKDRV